MVLSNLGRVQGLDFGPAGELMEFWFSPPVKAELGLALGVAGLGDRLSLCFRYHRTAFSSAAVQRFANLFMDGVEAEDIPELARNSSGTPQCAAIDPPHRWGAEPR